MTGPSPEVADQRRGGWLRLYRRIREHPRYTERHFLHFWVHLLLSAEFAPRKARFDGRMTTIQPGQLITSRRTLSEETGIDAGKVQRLLNELETDDQIAIRCGHKHSLITLLNWRSYQSQGEETKTDPRTDPRPDPRKAGPKAPKSEATAPDANRDAIRDLIQRAKAKKIDPLATSSPTPDNAITKGLSEPMPESLNGESDPRMIRDRSTTDPEVIRDRENPQAGQGEIVCKKQRTLEAKKGGRIASEAGEPKALSQMGKLFPDELKAVRDAALDRIREIKEDAKFWKRGEELRADAADDLAWLQAKAESEPEKREAIEAEIARLKAKPESYRLIGLKAEAQQEIASLRQRIVEAEAALLGRVDA